MSSSKARNYHTLSRPSPLRISRSSHLIQKPSSFPPSSSSSSIISADKNQQLQQQPVIIYDNSPKVIYTPACDFMALVQRLTGNYRSEVAAAPVVGRSSAASTPNENSSSSSNSREEPIEDLFSPIPLHYYRFEDPSEAFSLSTMELMKALEDY